MLRFPENDFGKTQNWEISYVTLATSNFQELFAMKFELKSSYFEIKIFSLKGFITKKIKRSGKNPPSQCKIGLTRNTELKS